MDNNLNLSLMISNKSDANNSIPNTDDDGISSSNNSNRQTKHMKSSSDDIDAANLNVVAANEKSETASYNTNNNNSNSSDNNYSRGVTGGSSRFFSSIFSSSSTRNENKSSNKNGPEKIATSSVLNTSTTFEKEREWGIFCMENKTDKPIYWGVKGLHIHWKKENSPLVLSSKTSAPCDYPPAYYFYNQPTESKLSSSQQNSTKFKSHRHFCFSSCHSVDLTNKGLPDWNNIIKYKLEPNTFCLGRFPFHTYSDYFILLVGLYDSETSSTTTTTTTTTTTSTTPPTNGGDHKPYENIFSKYFSSGNTSRYSYSNATANSTTSNAHNGGSSSVPKTQTSVELFDENEESSSDKSKQTDKSTKKKSPFHCKAYFIEHFHNKDVILGANVNKSLFLFSDYSTFTLEPITYRFFPNYRPCENASIDPIKLSNNIYYDEIREVSIRKGHKKKVSESASRNALQFHGLQMYEDEATNTLRESILFFFLYLRKLDERLNILLLLDISEIDQTTDSYMEENLMEYLMKFLIGSTTITHTESQKGYLIQWFQSCVKLIGYNCDERVVHDEENRFVLFRRDDVCCRSFSMYKFKETSTETEDFFKNEEEEELSKQSIEPHSNVDGVIVLSTVGNKMEKGLKDKLKLLEGFPTLFVLHGLDKCTDIYDAIKRKEGAEIEISSLYSNSKPFIVQHKSQMTKSQTSSTELILSQFFREVIDVALERVTVQHPKHDSSTSINTVMKLFSNSEVKIEIKDLQEYEQKRNVWFFGLDNERETVSVAVNSFYSAKSYLECSKAKKNQKQTNNILICVRNREQFMNGKDIIPEKRIQSVNNYVVVKRTITDLWTGMNAPTKRRRSTDSNNQSSMKKSHSYGTLQSLSRKERAKKLDSFRTSVETPQLLPLPNDKGIFEMQANDDSEGSDTETDTISNASLSINQNNYESSGEDGGEFDENAIVLVKNDSEEEDKKSEDSINLKQNVNNEKKTSCYPIQKGDVVVLCLELSGRILITGENGVYSRFIQEILTYTDKIVLFVERMDRREFTQPATIIMKSNPTSKKLCCVFGDEEDMKLDEELCESQDMKNLKYRCYYSSERSEDKNQGRKFWESVLHRNCAKMEISSPPSSSTSQ